FGNQQTRHDLILSIDADEVVSNELALSIKKALNDYQAGTLFELNVLSKFEDSFIFHGGWYPDLHTRIFDRTTTLWNNTDVHERLQTGISARKIRLQGHLLHYTAPDKLVFREKMRKYAVLFARNRFEKEIKFGIAKKYISSAFRFL